MGNGMPIGACWARTEVAGVFDGMSYLASKTGATIVPPGTMLRLVRLIEQESGRSFGLSEEDMSKAYVEMSGRRGIGVKADEFLDVLEA